MSDTIEKLLSSYERGRMTRRELVASLATLALALRLIRFSGRFR
jgi:hypothetical protein